MLQNHWRKFGWGISFTNSSWFSLLNDCEAQESDKLESLLLHNGLPCKSEELSVLCTIGDQAYYFAKLRPYIPMRIGKRGVAYIVSKQDYPIFVEQLAHEIEAFDGIGFIIRIRELHQIGRAIEQANQAARQYFLTGRKGMLYTYKPRRQQDTDLLTPLVKSVQQSDAQGLRVQFDRMLPLFRSCYLDEYFAMVLFNKLISVMPKSQNEGYEEYLASPEMMLEFYPDVQDLLNNLLMRATDQVSHNDIYPYNLSRTTFKSLSTI